MVLAKLLDFSVQNTPFQQEAFYMVSVGCSPNVFVDYLMLNKSIDFENLTVEVLGPWGFIRGNLVLAKLLDFSLKNTTLEPEAFYVVSAW